MGADLQQGPIVDTAAVGDITGDGQPEIVVGTNEEYTEPLNVGNFELSPAFDALSAAGAGDLGKSNSRLFAIKSTGDDHASAPRPDHNEDAFLDHWPFAVAQLQSDLLPVVGEGITGAPVIGPASMDCGANGGTGPKVGVIPDSKAQVSKAVRSAEMPQQDQRNRDCPEPAERRHLRLFRRRPPLEAAR